MKYLKKGADRLGLLVFLALACVLLALPVSAELSIDSLAKSTYNLGDKFFVSGNVIGRTAEQNLAFELVCGDRVHPLSARQVYLIPGKNTSFSERFSIPRLVSGLCFVRGILSYAAGNNSVADTAVSSEFLVTKELAASILINKSEIQLGQDALITGLITKLDSTTVSGVAKINFKSNGVIYFSEDLDLTNGVVYFPVNSSLFVGRSKIPAGNYSVVVSAFDVYGNEQDFGIPFIVSDLLVVESNLDKKEYFPGDSILVSGTAYPEIASSVDSGSVKISLDELFFKADVRNNKFSYTLALPSSIKSGSHIIAFLVSDKYGNNGESESEFYVIPIASLVLLEPNQKSYKPEDILRVKSFVYDQASELMNGSVSVYLFSPQNKVVFNSTSVSGGTASFTLPKFFAPGVYTLRSVVIGKSAVFADLKINVEGIESVALSLSNSTISIVNTGNIEYEKVLTISALDSTNQTYYLNKKLALPPAGSAEIVLGQELPSGNYSFILPKTAGQPEQVVSSVEVVDERSGFKKTADGISSLTGFSFAGAYNIGPTSSVNALRQFALSIFAVLAVGGVAVGLYLRKSAKKSYIPHDGQNDAEKTSISAWIERKIEEEKIVNAGVAQENAAKQVNKMLREKRQSALDKETAAAEREALRKDPYVQQFVRRSIGEDKKE